MTIKEKKRLLKQYGEIDERIEQLRRERERSRACDTYHSPLGSELAGGKPPGTVVEIAVEKRDTDFDMLIKCELKQLYDLRVAIEHAISNLTNVSEQRVLRLYYLGLVDEFGERQPLKMLDVARKMNYSERQIQRIHKAALLHLPDINCKRCRPMSPLNVV